MVWRVLKILLTVLFMQCVTVLSALAETPAIDYELWDKQAKYAERQLENGEVSESLRKQIAEWRSVLLTASEANKNAISTLEAQIEALGPVPDEGVEDPLADRRNELSLQLAELKAPSAKAREAFQRADGLIKKIDQTIRTEQASRLIHLGPSPLNVTAWTTALTDLNAFQRGLQREVNAAFATPSSVQSLKDQAASLFTRILLSLILIVAAPMLIGRFLRVTQENSASKQRLSDFARSLVILAFRVAGWSYLLSTVMSSGIFEVRGTLILSAALGGGLGGIYLNWPLWILGSIWIGQRLFNGTVASLPLRSRADTRIAITYITVLATAIVVDYYLMTVAKHQVFTEQTEASLRFIPLLFAAFALYRLVHIPFADPKTDATEEELETSAKQSVKWRLIALFRRVSKIIAIAAPLIGSVGFFNAAHDLLYPLIQTLALFAVIYVLQILVSDIYAELRPKSEEAPDDALIPVLVGFVFVLLALPLFALIWGTRSADLIEIWNAVKQGVPLGDARLSPLNLLTFLVIFIVGYMATRLLQSALKGSILPKTGIDTGAQTALVSGVGYLGIFLAAVIAISSAGLDLSSLAIVAGALSVGIGFGLQNIVSNFVSGIILLIERPVSEGDWVEVGGKMGYVRNISVRSTRIETFDRTDLIVPNADLVSGVVTNYTRGNTVGRVVIPVGVAYGTDTRRVSEILLDIIQQQPMVTKNPSPSVVLKGFGADSLDFEIRAILHDVNYGLSVKSEVNHQIAERFAQEGIEIPFAQRDIWIRNPETLTGKPTSS